ncbi:MAG: hypothetical protein K8U03_21480 [Planctomycetia bacterium]|nr:hypothetical protein [Planctomycetia bacterium]
MFSRLSTRWRIAALIVCGSGALLTGSSAGEAQAAVPAAETLIPAGARAFVSVRNTKDIEAAVKKTKFGGIFKEESLKPFVTDVRAQIDARIAESQSSLGLGIEDFKNLSDGEVAFTVVDLGAAATADFHGATGTAVLVDVTGHDKELAAVRGKITAALGQKKAVAAAFKTEAGAAGIRYDIPPPKEGHPTVVMVEVAHTTPAGILWIVSDSPTLTGIISAAFAGQAMPSLAQNETFQKLMKRTNAAAGEPAPLVVGYADPLGLAAALRAYQFPPKKIKPDPLKVANDAGLNGILGVGGQAVVANGDLGTLLRVGVVTKKPYEKAMQMFAFPVGADFVPQPWVRQDIVGYTTLHWDTMQAFDNFGPIFDGFLEQAGIWKEVVESLKTDPDGPQVDVRGEFFSLLGTRLTLIADKKLPPALDSSQFCLAIEIKKGANAAETEATEKKLTETLSKAFKGDPSVEKTEIILGNGKLDVWKITSTEEVPPAAANQAGVVNGVRVVFRAYVTVHNGHVLIGSDLDALGKVMAPAEGGGLALSPDYVAVTNVLGKYIPTEASQPIALGFNRSDELLRVDYELFKAGKMAGSQTLLGRLFDLVWREAEKEGRTIKALDGSKLPPFEKIQKYLSPTGMIISNSEDGLFLLGFTLEKIPAAAAAPAAPPK